MIRRIFEVFSIFRSETGLIYVTIGNFFFAIFGAILWFFLATQMPTADYGSLNYFISVAAIFASVGLMGFDSTLTTYLAKGMEKIRTESASLVLVAAAILSVSTLLIFDSFALVLAFLGVLFFSMSSAELLGRHRYREFMLIMVGERSVSLISVPVLFWINGVEGALIGYAISYLPFSYRFFSSLRRFDLKLSCVKSIKSFFFHSYGLGISKTFVYSSDKLIIMPLFGLTILGQYQFGIQILTALSIIPLILYNYLLPQHAGGKSNNKRLGMIELYGVIVSLILTVILILAMPIIVNTFFSGFSNAIFSSQIVVCAAIPLSISAICNSILLSRERSSWVIIGAVIFLISQYTLLIILGAAFSLEGLAIATVIASVIQALFLYLARKRTSDKKQMQ